MALLKEVLNVIQELNKDSVSTNEFLTGHRQCLTFLVEYTLTDLSKKLTESKVNGEISIALSVLEHCQGRPVSDIYSFRDKKSEDFTLWLLSRLTRIYSSTHHVAHHNQILSIHSNILNAIKARECKAYKKLMSLLIGLLADICLACESASPFTCSISDVDNICDNCIKGPVGFQNMRRIDISISTPEQMECLMSNLLKLFRIQMPSVIQLGNHGQQLRLLKCLKWSLEYLDAQNKAEACLTLSNFLEFAQEFSNLQNLPMSLMQELSHLVANVSLFAIESGDVYLGTSVISLLKQSLRTRHDHYMISLGISLCDVVTGHQVLSTHVSDVSHVILDVLASCFKLSSPRLISARELLCNWMIKKILPLNINQVTVCCLGEILISQLKNLDRFRIALIEKTLQLIETAKTDIVSKLSILNSCCNVIAQCCLQQPIYQSDPVVRFINCLSIMWKDTLSTVEKDDVMKVFRLVTEGISIICCIIGPSSHLYSSTTTQLMAICSLPWLHMESQSDSDFDIKLSDELFAVAGELNSPTNTDSAVCSALKPLMLFDGSAYPKWRIKILQKTVSSRRPTAVSILVEHLPGFIYETGVTSRHLIYDVIHPALTLQSIEVDEAIANSLKFLVCIASGSAERTISKFDANIPVWKIKSFTCNQCDLSYKGKRNHVDPGMFEPVMSLLHKDKENIRATMATNLRHIFNHITVYHANGETMSMLQSSLMLLSDPALSVRVRFHSIPYEAFRNASMEVLGQFVDKITTLNSATKDIELKETLIMTVFSLGKLDDMNLFPICLQYFVENYLSNDTMQSMTAYQYLHKLAGFKQISPSQIYQQNRLLMAECLSEKVTDILSSSYDDGLTVMDLFVKASKLFQYDSINLFLRDIEKYIIPHLVNSDHKDIHQVIKLVASHVGKTYQQVLSTNIQYIFSFLIRSCDRPTFEQKLAYIESESQLNIGTLLRQSFQRVLNHLLLYLGCRHQQIKLGLAYLLRQTEKTNNNNDNAANSSYVQVPDCRLSVFIEQHLLGVLVYYDQTLLQRSSHITYKENIITSLIQLMKLLGKKRITVFRIKIATSLKLALSSTTGLLLKVCCQAWLCFVQHIEMAALKSMLSPIVVTLLPLLRTVPDDVAEVFKYLIVKHRKELCDAFGDLYFIPDVPQLAEVNAVLKNYMVFSGRPDAFPMQLKQYLSGVKHENSEVSKQALLKLKSLLVENREQLLDMISGSETVAPIISDAMSKLMSGCMKSGDNDDDDVKLLYADCLAEFGAIDPGRMLTSTESMDQKTNQKALDEINSPTFLLCYLDVLVKALLSADSTNVQDCVALAVQGSLTLYSVTNSDSNEVWQCLSQETQDIITPYFESKYTIVDPNWLKVESPVYMSEKGKSFGSWLCKWTALMASKVKDGFAKQLFKSSMAAISASVDLALFMLPYVVTYTIAEDVNISILRDDVMLIIDGAQHGKPSEFCHVALQTLFTVFDELKIWLNKPKHRVSKVTTRDDMSENSSITKVKRFLDGLPHDKMARASLNCQNVARSLQHYERHIDGEDIQDHLDTLQEIYAAMDEPDGVSGVDAIRIKPASLHQQAAVWENVDKLRDAMVCYEEAINANPSDLAAHEGLMKGYLTLGNWYRALSYTPATANQDITTLNQQLLSYKVEAAWKLGNWDKLNDLVTSSGQSGISWSTGIGKLLLSVKNKQKHEFYDIRSQLMKYVMGPLSAAHMKGNSLQRSYQYLVQLHTLKDIECAANTCLFDSKSKDIESLLRLLDDRMNIVQSNVKTTDSLVTLKHTLLMMLQEELPDVNLGDQMQNCWLKRSSIARKANQLVNAYVSLEKAAKFGLAEREVEKAKLLWHRGDSDHAITCLGRVINSHYEQLDLTEIKLLPNDSQVSYAEVYLLYAWYNEGNSKFERAEVMKYYKRAIDLCPTWEIGYFRLAVYYDKYLASRPDNVPLYWKVYKQAIQNYAMSMKCGSRNVYQAMSRTITLWLDLGSEIASKTNGEKLNDETKATLKHQQAALAQISTDCISMMMEHIAGFQWLTVFTQLVSRVCHSHPDVSTQLQELIAKLIVEFPQQTVWNMMAISKSSYPIRHQRCQAIFELAKSKASDLTIFIRDITRLTDRLLELTNKTVERSVHHLSLGDSFRPLKRLLDDPNFSEIMLPTQSAMTVTLPSESNAGVPKQHNAFPLANVYLKNFQERIDVLSSMIRPKKLTCIGSDGRNYPFLCKPKDDLRKDSRLMEFNSIVNKILRKDPTSRRMQLYIKTYSVIPLSEECGLLEWINNTTPYRHVLNALYKEVGCYISMAECVKAYKVFNCRSPVEERMPTFLRLRDKHPPILHMWFSKNFHDPTSWYNARVTYARTLAVMSVAGYIVGLGDRHGENILLDSTTGGIMHVDFNCLFNKGLTFDWPEVVPFRLTHNMVNAMGPMGYEGMFRKAAEVTLRIMTQEKDQLMSVLRPFIYDPLVEWSKPVVSSSRQRKGKQQKESGEIKNEQAKLHVQTIEEKLVGEPSENRGLWLSIEGRVQDLIKEATDNKNLAKMYAGWAAFF